MRILLTGTARCGSTWAANVLGRADGAKAVFEPDGPASDVLGAMVAARLGSHPALDAAQRSFWYRQLWDLAFVGGWPMARAEGVRAAGRRVSRHAEGIARRSGCGAGDGDEPGPSSVPATSSSNR